MAISGHEAPCARRRPRRRLPRRMRGRPDAFRAGRGARGGARRRDLVRRARRRAAERAPRLGHARCGRLRGLRRARRPRGPRARRDALPHARGAHRRDHGRAAREDGHRREPVPRAGFPVRDAHDGASPPRSAARRSGRPRAGRGAASGSSSIPGADGTTAESPRRLRPHLAREGRAGLGVRPRRRRRLDRRGRLAAVRSFTPARAARVDVETPAGPATLRLVATDTTDDGTANYDLLSVSREDGARSTALGAVAAARLVRARDRVGKAGRSRRGAASRSSTRRSRGRRSTSAGSTPCPATRRTTAGASRRRSEAGPALRTTRSCGRTPGLRGPRGAGRAAWPIT